MILKILMFIIICILVVAGIISIIPQDRVECPDGGAACVANLSKAINYGCNKICSFCETKEENPTHKE